MTISHSARRPSRAARIGRRHARRRRSAVDVRRRRCARDRGRLSAWEWTSTRILAVGRRRPPGVGNWPAHARRIQCREPPPRPHLAPHRRPGQPVRDRSRAPRVGGVRDRHRRRLSRRRGKRASRANRIAARPRLGRGAPRTARCIRRSRPPQLRASRKRRSSRRARRRARRDRALSPDRRSTSSTMRRRRCSTRPARRTISS